MLHDGRVVVEELVLPVGAEALHGIAVDVSEVVRVGIERRLSAVDILLVLQDGIVGSTGDVALAPWALPAIREVVVDLGFALRAFLRGDEDDTVGRTRTVDGSGSSVFEHFDALNILGVDELHAVLVGSHAIDDVERVGVVDGTDTAHTDHRLGTGLAGSTRDVDAGGQTFQGILGAQLCLALEVFGIDLGDRGRDDTLLLDAIADDDHIAERLGIVL